MSQAHYITAVWVEDQLGGVIFFHEFNYTESAATVSFTVPAGVTLVRASKLRPNKKSGTCDPYVQLSLGRVKHTSLVVQRELEPHWYASEFPTS